MEAKRRRKKEILKYQRDMFFHEEEKGLLIKKLLKKIYVLEDKVESLESTRKHSFDKYDAETNHL